MPTSREMEEENELWRSVRYDAGSGINKSNVIGSIFYICSPKPIY